MPIKIHPSWKKHLETEFDKAYFKNLTDFIKEEYEKNTIYPHPKNIFRAFDLCPFKDVKVVILGQDPYHGKGQANGLCFSVNNETPLPPSLELALFMKWSIVKNALLTETRSSKK